jgi:hypothetical protein
MRSSLRHEDLQIGSGGLPTHKNLSKHSCVRKNCSKIQQASPNVVGAEIIKETMKRYLVRELFQSLLIYLDA